MKEDKAMFVKALGAALAYSRTGVIDLDYDKDPDGFEAVTIFFEDGGARAVNVTVNVTGDSCLAIMHDVYKALI